MVRIYQGCENQCDPLAEIPDTVSRWPEDATIRSGMVGCPLEFLEQFPETSREVYALSELADLPYEEIARNLSLTLAMIKIKLHRACARPHEELRSHCHCYRNERGELMGAPKGR